MLSGWKDMSRALDGIPIPTLQECHYKYLTIPFIKSYPSKQGRVVISEDNLKKWMKQLSLMHPSLYSFKNNGR